MVKYICELFDYSYEKQLKAQFDANLVDFVLNDRLCMELKLHEYDDIKDGAFYDCVWDFIAELADSRVDIYYYDIRKWAVDNWSHVEDAMNEGLTEGVTDYHKLIQIGQFYKIEQDLRDDLYNLIEEIKDDAREYYEQQQIELEL